MVSVREVVCRFFYCNIFCILFDIKDLIFLCVQSSMGCMCVCIGRALAFVCVGCD